ncbi:MAG: hypothetical protein ABIP48_09445 [Planctomycetota bacterium]
MILNSHQQAIIAPRTSNATTHQTWTEKHTALTANILTAAQIDRFDGVPELDTHTFRIRLS